MKAFRLRQKVVAINRRLRQTQMIARALKSRLHPIEAQIIPIRRCNLSCTYCNEFDSSSRPVLTGEMVRRVDLLAALGTATITISGGEPLLHPELDEIIKRIRSHGMLASLITNGYLLTPERIKRLNDAGLDHLQISIDNVNPDDVSKKSLRVLQKKLRLLADYALFDVNVNSVVGSSIRTPEDAVVITQSALDLGLSTTMGLIHNDSGMLQPLDNRQQTVFQQIERLKKPFHTAALYNRFHKNLARGLRNDWHCRAGSRYLYICEDGLVHYCSQQRGVPGIPLEKYEQEDIEREYHSVKGCAPYCTISCVQRGSMIDELRENPVAAINRFFPSRESEPGSEMPIAVRVLTWLLLPTEKTKRRIMRHAALRVLGMK
ncbi:MAG TPA: radical SAM protein [Pyrinomonadaceae bacterium]|nr:radical SAM protein [Pyrinomonadaceae bacterium]